ncbi:haloacid dehalogenase [Magnaporthiopsis poae ATCC 64411]|uniref:Haloacid dehalogenase n=1 Tax=Magnaporthiopsis poae (strain ATCC 64411 / 73-15) TaxID=644358 RepID=A0A0C4DZF0_MAGP6|nr:haloacid dehalogenase [Magnaporthiopsis poae ATCC 64411]
MDESQAQPRGADGQPSNPITALGGQIKALTFDIFGTVAMVAAHLGDLEGARACGLRTVYVERAGEEVWGEDEDRYKDARKWVDVWIPLGSEGLLELARRLGA